MPLIRLFSFGAALTLLVTSSSLQSQTTNSSAQSTGAPTVAPTTTGTVLAARSMRASRASAAITIDGKLDEAAWATAPMSSDFTQSYPKVGAKPTDPTEVRVL